MGIKTDHINKKFGEAINATQAATRLSASQRTLKEFCETNSHETVEALIKHVHVLTATVIAMNLEKANANISQCNDAWDIPDPL